MAGQTNQKASQDQNNAYFEQQLSMYMAQKPEGELVQRVSDCQTVIDNLEKNPIWFTVINDANEWVARLDSNWQDIKDPEQLNAARVLKSAYMHIVNLPAKYKADLETCRNELDKRNNDTETVVRDYDTESNYEV